MMTTRQKALQQGGVGGPPLLPLLSLMTRQKVTFFPEGET
jgi:hypothetical protein